jgi:hypothetical protein
VLAAALALALPLSAGATVYDKQLYDELVSDGTAADHARCASALAGARVTLERYLNGYFVAVEVHDPAIDPNTNPQETDDDGNYSWEVGEGDYRVSVTRKGYWRTFSGIVSGPGAVLEEDVALKRRPGTVPPEPRDCGDLGDSEPKSDPEPQPEPRPEPAPKETCQLRPVNARVRGSLVRKVVFTLDGRVVKRVTRPDADGNFAVQVERDSLPRGKHVLRAKVIFVRRADRRPEVLRLAIRRCPERLDSHVAKATAPDRCISRPFNAWVRAHRVRRVSFRLNGRKLKSVTAADWRGRYGVKIDTSALRPGRHVVAARIDFLRGSGVESRTVRMRFSRCG